MRGITGFSITDVSRISWVISLRPFALAMGLQNRPRTFALQQKNKPLHAICFPQKHHLLLFDYVNIIFERNFNKIYLRKTKRFVKKG